MPFTSRCCSLSGRCRFFGEELTWNLRDHHFLDTVKSLRSHLTRRVPAPKLILWAHNSHLGDASATDMGQRRGEINIGQLMRQEFGAKAVFNIG
jgi:erythromycin esterase-like protein